MEIHVQNQTAGVITYVDGNQVVYGGLHGSVVTDDDAWRAVGDLRAALTSVPLDGPREAEARARTAQVDYAEGGATAYWNLAWLCYVHHRMKSKGWTLGPPDPVTGKRRLQAPDADRPAAA